MKPTPLRLEEIVYPLVCVRAISVPGESPVSFEREFDSDRLKIHFRFELEEDDKTATAGVRIKSTDTWSNVGPPYEIDIEVFAIFKTNGDGLDDEAARKHRESSALTLLVGAAREHIASITSRGPWGTALLPMLRLGATPTTAAKKVAARRVVKRKIADIE